MDRLFPRLSRTKALLAGAALAAAIATPGAAFAQAESSDPIRIVHNNWTSQVVLSHIVGQLLEKQGYNVEYRPSDGQLQFIAMANNDLDFQIEVWQGSHKSSFDAALEQGLVEFGDHNAITREDWWYPTYVKEVCPGLPDWEALNACAEAFATAETQPKGRFLGPPADWGKHYSERIEALGMDFQEVPVGQAATLWAELQAAFDRKEPIVLFNWTPNFIEAQYEGEFVEFPEYAAECLTDPAWGMNPDAVYDCGAPPDGYLKKAGSPQLEEKWPGAAEILRKVDFPNTEISVVAKMVDLDGMSPEEAAAKWIEDNEDKWSAWLG